MGANRIAVRQIKTEATNRVQTKNDKIKTFSDKWIDFVRTNPVNFCGDSNHIHRAYHKAQDIEDKRKMGGST